MARRKILYDPNKLIRGIVGFITYSLKNNLTDQQILSNVIHDLTEYLKDSKEPWFCPRTSNYEKYCLL